MLLPKRVKYRRVQRGRMTGKATRGNVVCQGQYGLVALEPAWISSTQIEAARVAMTRYIELADVDEATAREALRLAMHKLPIKCKFVVREDSVKEDGTNEG